MGNLSFVFDEGVIISLASLAAKDSISGSSKIDAARENGFRVVKSEGWAFLKAQVVDEPVLFGIAARAMSASEIEEVIEVDPQSMFQVPEAEQALRPVFPMGAIMGSSAGVFNPPVHFMNDIPWSYREGSAMFYWAYNPDNDAFSAGSQELILFVKHTGVWLRD